MMKARCLVMLAAGTGLWVLSGCVTAPERIDVQVGSDRPARVDSSRVPRTSSHAECREELERAYANLQYLERQNARLKEKAAENKREREECEDRLERYED